MKYYKMKIHPRLIRKVAKLSCRIICLGLFIFFESPVMVSGQSRAFDLKLEQVTSGTRHHFFGYIGQCQTVPWNATGQYILGLQIDTITRMPKSSEYATIVLINTFQDNHILRIDSTCAWNPQQGTMFYWNPLAAETQFFFNDRDLHTGKVFTVLFDIVENRRVREYRYDDTPIGNGGVAPDGSAWLGLNYGRLARLRLVTGYPDAMDWSKEHLAPRNDGIFKVDIRSGKKHLLVSYRQLEEKLREKDPDLEHGGLFINHTLWNRNSDQIYFFVRAGWNGPRSQRINTPFSIRADGSDLVLHDIHIGGHPEWADSIHLIGREGDKQILYHVDERKVTSQLGTPKIFPDPEGDIALSPDGNWFVNGHQEGTKNYYTVYRRSDGAFARSEGLGKGLFSGDIRIDPAPRWNRTGDAILVPGIDDNQTRQIFLLRVVSDQK